MVRERVAALKESLWAAGLAAFTIHGLAVSAFALGNLFSEGKGTDAPAAENVFRAEILFTQASPENDTCEATPVSFVQEEGGEVPQPGLNLGSLPTVAECSDQIPDLIAKSKDEAPLSFDPAASRLRSGRTGSGENLLNRPHSSSSMPKTTSRKQWPSPQPPSSPSAPSSGAREGKPLSNPAPAYPLAARRKKAEGIVHLRLSLTESGTVEKAAPLSPRTDPVLEEAALNAVYQWKFTPGVRTVDVPIEFKLV